MLCFARGMGPEPMLDLLNFNRPQETEPWEMVYFKLYKSQIPILSRQSKWQL